MGYRPPKQPAEPTLIDRAKAAYVDGSISLERFEELVEQDLRGFYIGSALPPRDPGIRSTR